MLLLLLLSLGCVPQQWKDVYIVTVTYAKETKHSGFNTRRLLS